MIPALQWKVFDVETVEHSVLANREHSAVGCLIQQFAIVHQFFYMIVHPTASVPCPLHNELFICLCEYSAGKFVFRCWEFFPVGHTAFLCSLHQVFPHF